MYRAFMAFVLLLTLTLAGCNTKEIDPEEQDFKANTEAASAGAQKSFEMQSQNMRPEQKAYFEQMMKNKGGPPAGGPGAGGPGAGGPTP